MKLRISSIVCLLVCLAWPIQALAVRFAYLPLDNGTGFPGDLAKVDTTTNSIDALIPVGVAPVAVAVSPSGARAYVVNLLAQTLSVVDTVAEATIATVPLPGGSVPTNVAVKPDGSRVYVTHGTFGNKVSVIDTATNSVIASIPVGSVPNSLALKPDGTRLYVANGGGTTVSVINTTTNAVIATVINVVPSATDVVVRADGKRVYVSGSAGISIINTTSNAVITTVFFAGGVNNLATNLAGTRLYAAQNNVIRIIDATVDTGTLLQSCMGAGSPFWLGLEADPTDTVAYAVSYFPANRMDVVDLSTCATTGTLPFGSALSFGYGSFVGSAFVPAAPTLTTTERNCQSAITSNAETYDEFIFDKLQGCLSGVLADWAANDGLLEIAHACWLDLNPAGSGTSNVKTKRDNAFADIDSACNAAGVSPAVLGNPCGQTVWLGASGIINCVLDQSKQSAEERIATQYGTACQLISAVGLEFAYSYLCPP